jgi:chromosome segregation ATPase
MPGTLEERVAYLEGKVEEHSRLGSELREMILHLDQKVDRFREELSSRIEALDQRLSGRIEALDQRLSGRIEALDQKFSRYFLWIIGVQVTIFLAIIATFLR